MPETLQAVATIEATLRNTTEAAAVAAADWIGAGDGIAADQAAVDAMHRVLSETDAFQATVVIGEGVKDEAPMLTHGAVYGSNPDVLVDFGADPIDGTTVVSKGEEGGIATVALAESGKMLDWCGIHYTKKLAVGSKLAELMADGRMGLDRDPRSNFIRAAQRLDKNPSELRVAILRRERNNPIIQGAHDLGISPIFLESGDIIPALLTSMPNGNLDMLYSSGGSPEAVLAAAGVAALGGNMQAMWDPQNKQEEEIARDRNQLNEVLQMSTLVGEGETHFALTAITAYKHFLAGCKKDESGQWQPADTWYLSRPAV